MAEVVNTRRLAYAFISAAVGDLSKVITRFSPDTANHLPVVLVDAVLPAAIANGRQEYNATEFSIRVDCWADNEDQAYDLALAVWENAHVLWREQFVTEYGWISYIARGSLQPARIDSTISNDDASCYQFVLQVVGRA